MSENPPPGLPPVVLRGISGVLRAGLLTALTLLAIALAIYAGHNPSVSWSSVVSSEPGQSYLTPGSLFSGLAGAEVDAFLALGVIVLALTPLARVLTGVWAFQRTRDRPLLLIAVTVFILLVLGIAVVGPLVR